MSSNDRHGEALSALRQGGTIPADNSDVREAVMAWLEAGEEGWNVGPTRACSIAIRDHNPHIDPYATTEGGDTND